MADIAIENVRRDKPFQQLLTLQKVPSTATLRQRLDKLAANDLQAHTAAWSTTLLSLVEAPITAETTHVCLDIDTFVMDNSNSKKEGVSRTYKKVDGYTPIAAYLCNEWRCLGLELRPGKQHIMKESNAFLGRVLPHAQGLTENPILLREDSGFDSQAHTWLCSNGSGSGSGSGSGRPLLTWAASSTISSNGTRVARPRPIRTPGGQWRRTIGKSAPWQTPGVVGTDCLNPRRQQGRLCRQTRDASGGTYRRSRWPAATRTGV
ncbi:hypothetical protein DU506_14970 [Vreelandella rituensis]|uniref:Transposase DDE domain-containing protein n=1 Tax=Vreelandella rituensis TaxID=2282306 RepID=A0A368TVE9_9GAMM|nr:hypothetical protein DU506_14970 [Halomonas rituensis]